MHDAAGGDNSVVILRNGLPTLHGPLAHWAVQSDGSIAFIADETRKAYHVGNADQGISNANSIGIEVTGIAALQNEKQIESLVRLVADVADRWNIPTARILSHAEVAVPRGRKSDMQQQTPIIRQMVDSVRTRKISAWRQRLVRTKGSEIKDTKVSKKIIYNRLSKIIVDRLQVEYKEVTMNANFTDNLGADSLDLVEVIMETEKEFKISISDFEAEKITTVGMLFDCIVKHMRHIQQ